MREFHEKTSIKPLKTSTQIFSEIRDIIFYDFQLKKPFKV